MDFSIRIVRSNRKSVAVQITPDRTVLVRAPYFVSEREIKTLIDTKQDWIKDRLSHLENVRKFTESEIKTLIQQAKDYIPERVRHYSDIIGTDFGRITIRCQKTRWGSCSTKGNLNFNCLLMLAPEKVIDSVIVHELCHRIEMNHSKRFYALIYKVMPDYDVHHKWLKDNGQALIAKIV